MCGNVSVGEGMSVWVAMSECGRLYLFGGGYVCLEVAVPVWRWEVQCVGLGMSVWRWVCPYVDGDLSSLRG